MCSVSSLGTSGHSKGRRRRRSSGRPGEGSKKISFLPEKWSRKSDEAATCGRYSVLPHFFGTSNSRAGNRTAVRSVNQESIQTAGPDWSNHCSLCCSLSPCRRGRWLMLHWRTRRLLPVGGSRTLASACVGHSATQGRATSRRDRAVARCRAAAAVQSHHSA